MPGRVFRSLFVLAACMALDGVTASSQATAVWSISRDPLVSVGGLGDDSLYELNRAESAIRLTTGEIVIANRGSFQLRWYDAQGRYLRSLGRRGQGPSEFRSPYVFEGPGDTVLVQDDTNRRLTRITPDGRYIGLDSSGTPTRESWLYDRSLVARLPVSVDQNRLRDVLLKIPRGVDDAIRGVLVDRSENAWVRGPKDSAAYVIYDASARRIGRIELPPRFEIFQAFDTLVLGRYRDEDGVEAIQLRRLTKGRTATGQVAASPRERYDEVAEVQAHRAAIASARAALRNLLTAQELHHGRHKRYASALADLGSFTLPDGVMLTLIAPTGNAYWLIAELKGVRAVCVVGVGSVVPFGYTESCG